MIQKDRDWLLNVSYGLDNKERLNLAQLKKKVKPTDKLVVFTDEQITKWAEDIRKMVNADATRLLQLGKKA